jgi:hypothetical protein
MEMSTIAARAARVIPPVREVSKPADILIEGSAWQAFAASQANTLMIGAPLPVTRALTIAWTSLRRPVVWCDAAQLRLPTGPVGTFIVWRADELTPDDQQHLSRWMENSESTRVLARSSQALYPLVEQGAFAADLYYRLNTVLLTTP